MAQQNSLTLKTYMSFAYPVDPANVKTLVDLDISYALSTSLVDWDSSRNLSEGLAKPVDSKNELEMVLQMRPEAKWSDGTSVTAKQVLRSIEHAKSLHDDAMKGLFEMITGIDAKDDRTLVFRLNRPVAQSQILSKLTDPVYGVLFIKDDGTEDLKKTTGAFVLTSASQKELVLSANPHWPGYQKSMPQTVIIRQPKTGPNVSEEGFADDPWPNLMASSSLMSTAAENNYKKQRYSIWNRNLDRLFFFSPGPRLRTSAGRALFQSLAKNLDRNTLLKGIGGYHLSDQFFPLGNALFDPEFRAATGHSEVPAEFKKKPLQLLAAEGRVDQALQSNIVASIKQTTGIEPKFHIVALNKLAEALGSSDYDIAVVSVAVNDPNVEGPVSFLFGINPPLIANADGKDGDFKSRVITARSKEEKNRNAEYRKIFTQATHAGAVLPLFHFSSIAIAREGIDLSGIPTTDETVAFAKVRFK